MDKYNQNSCTSIESFKYNIYSDIEKCETIIDKTQCEIKRKNFTQIIKHLKHIKDILDNYENTEKKELKKHTMNLRPRKNKANIGSVEVIGKASPYPFYNFSL
tara:strand:+ start:179 stop:487 length:309 start_codon:yes stop_codon:yes gene_type:complete